MEYDLFFTLFALNGDHESMDEYASIKFFFSSLNNESRSFSLVFFFSSCISYNFIYYFKTKDIEYYKTSTTPTKE